MRVKCRRVASSQYRGRRLPSSSSSALTTAPQDKRRKMSYERMIQLWSRRVTGVDFRFNFVRERPRPRSVFCFFFFPFFVCSSRHNTKQASSFAQVVDGLAGWLAGCDTQTISTIAFGSAIAHLRAVTTGRNRLVCTGRQNGRSYLVGWRSCAWKVMSI